MESYYMAIVPFQSFLDSSHTGIVERHVRCAESHASCWICRSVWQLSVTLFNNLRKQKLINIFNYYLQKYYR